MLYHLEHVSVPLDGSHVLVHFFLLSRIIFFYNLFLVIEKKKLFLVIEGGRWPITKLPSQWA